MRPRLACSIFAVALVGCGVEFDPPSEVKTLRVLGVQKTAPYAMPGEDVTLSMLWHDGSPKAPRAVQVAWLSGCFNPPGDLYAGCAQSFAEAGGAGGSGGTGGSAGIPGLPPGISVGLGNTFTFTMPADIISSRPPPSDSKLPAYGLAYVFFAVCAGELGPAATSAQGATFPIGCFDAGGKPLGSDDFVAGYSAVYAYDSIRNENPIITGFKFNGVTVTPSCQDEDCLTVPTQTPDCAGGDPCIDPCSDDGDPACPAYDITAVVDPASAELDEVSKIAYDRSVTEQLWVDYYVDRGGLKSPVKLVSDAQKGFNDDYSTEFYAPKKSGTLSIWAVVHDNRGGMSWVRTEVGVR